MKNVSTLDIQGLGIQELNAAESLRIDGGVPSPDTSIGYDFGYLLGSIIHAIGNLFN